MSFMTRFVNLLEDRKFKEVLELFTLEDDGTTEDVMSEVVHVVADYLTESNAQSEQELFQCCKIVLNTIAERYNPMETVLEFLEHIECLDNDVKFYAILEPLGICMMRMKDKGKAIEWCVSTIKSYVEDLPVPDSDADQDAVNYRIMNIYEKIILFLEPLVQEAMKINTKLEEESLFGDYLLSLLISLRGEPFCFLNKSIVEKVTYKELSNKIATLSFSLTGDVLYFLDIVSNRWRNIIRDGAKDGYGCTENYIRSMLFELSDNVSNLAYANFYFHIITEETFWIHVPQVYSPYYILEMCMYFFNVLLYEEQEISVSNGLTFMENVIKRISPCSVDSKVLSLKIYSDLFEPIIKVMIYCNSYAKRKKAVQVFQRYIQIFDMEARYSVISYLYEIGEHSGLLSLITNIFKSCVIECLNSTPQNPHFLGKKMESMLKKICKLPNGSSSDLVEISDEIITALNLLRFLFIRNKQNEIGIWNMRDAIENDYLKPLREGIDLCRAHWRVKIKDLEQQKNYAKIRNYDKIKQTEAEVTLTVGGERLPIMPLAEKIAFCYQAINGLDVMESVLIRVNECINVVESTVEPDEYATRIKMSVQS